MGTAKTQIQQAPAKATETATREKKLTTPEQHAGPTIAQRFAAPLTPPNGSPNAAVMGLPLKTMRIFMRLPQPLRAPDSAKMSVAQQRRFGNANLTRMLQRVQAKIAVGAPGDRYEQEADDVANRIVSRQKVARISRLFEGELTLPVSRQTPEEKEEETLVRTKSAQHQSVDEKEPIEAPLQRQTEKEYQTEELGSKMEETKGLQAKAVSGGSVDNASAGAEIKSPGGGRPLPDGIRAEMEEGFGADFSGVRVHDTANDHTEARRLKAKAFTYGKDIWMGPDASTGDRKLMAHELTHVVQQGAAIRRSNDTNNTIHGVAGFYSGPAIQRQAADDEQSPKIKRLDEMLNRINVPEGEVINLLGTLDEKEVNIVLRKYRNLIANALNVSEMVDAIKNLKPRPKLPVALEWVKSAASVSVSTDISYSDIKDLITFAQKDKSQLTAMNTTYWRSFFVDVCDNETIFTAVNDLKFKLKTKLEWIRAEMGWISVELKYSEIQSIIKEADQKDRNALKTTAWRDFFTQVCDNETMITAVGDLRFDLETKLKWVIAEVNWVLAELNYSQIKPLITGTTDQSQRDALKTDYWRDIFTKVCTDKNISEALKDLNFDLQTKLEWTKAEGADLEPILNELLAYIKSEAEKKAKTPPSISPGSKFYKVLKDDYLKDFIANPTAAEGLKAIDKLGRKMEGRRSAIDPTKIEIKPEGGMWRPAENRWERGAILYWNKQMLPTLPKEVKDLPIFKNIKTLPSDVAAATDVLIKEKTSKLPYIDVPFLLGKPNLSTGHLMVDVVKGGKNISQLMHWATGIKYSGQSPEAIRELFLAYELWHLEGWDVFGQDALNDLIAEEQGRLLGTELKKGAGGSIKSNANLLAFLNRSFLQARAWVGALLRLRQAQLDEWIKAEEQPMAVIHWDKSRKKDVWRGAKSINQMLESGISIDDVKKSGLVKSQIEIYTLVYEAIEWEAVHGKIEITPLQKALVAGKFDNILAVMAKGKGASFGEMNAASNEIDALEGGGGGS